jgi:hypothetical protein
MSHRSALRSAGAPVRNRLETAMKKSFTITRAEVAASDAQTLRATILAITGNDREAASIMRKSRSHGRRPVDPLLRNDRSQREPPLRSRARCMACTRRPRPAGRTERFRNVEVALTHPHRPATDVHGRALLPARCLVADPWTPARRNPSPAQPDDRRHGGEPPALYGKRSRPGRCRRWRAASHGWRPSAQVLRAGPTARRRRYP